MNKIQKSLLGAGLLALAMLLTTYLALAALGNNLNNISETGTDAGYPAIAVSQNGQNIGIVWAKRYVGGGSVQGPIYFIGSTNGLTLTGKKLVDNANSVNDQSSHPDIASDPTGPTNMHLVWRNIQNETNYIIYYARCTIGLPSTCTAHEQVAAVTGGNVVNQPQVTANATAVAGVHVIYQLDNTGSGGTDKQIFYRGKKGDGSWATPVALSTAATHAFHPAIAVSNNGATNYVHAVWAADTDKDGTNDVIRYSRGTVGGDGTVATWSGSQSLPMPAGANNPDYPEVAAIGDTVVVLWDAHLTSSGNDDRYYAVYVVSTDYGVNFSPQAKNIADDSTTVYTARRSDNNPTSGANALLASEHARRLQIQAAFQPGTSPVTGILHLVWHQTVGPVDGTYKHDVHYSLRPFAPGDDCGEGPGSCLWAGVTNETQNNKLGSNPSAPYYSMSPAVAIGSDGKVRVVYMESKEDGEYEVGGPSDPNDNVIDVIYNGSAALNDDPNAEDDPDPGDPGDPHNPKPTFYLPGILKGS